MMHYNPKEIDRLLNVPQRQVPYKVAIAGGLKATLNLVSKTARILLRRHSAN